VLLDYGISNKNTIFVLWLFNLTVYLLQADLHHLMQIQSEGHSLQLGVKDALLNALLVAAKRFSSGPPQVLQISLD
jgi:alpha-amylase/alpha-mannosidase (GH57 family)